MVELPSEEFIQLIQQGCKYVFLDHDLPANDPFNYNFKQFSDNGTPTGIRGYSKYDKGCL